VVAHLTGDILRDARRAGTTPAARRTLHGAGLLVPDEVVIGIVADVSRRRTTTGFLLDGFPRERAAAEALAEMLGRAGSRSIRRLDQRAGGRVVVGAPRGVFCRSGGRVSSSGRRPRRAGRPV